MVRIKSLVVFGFFAVLVHDLHAQNTVGSIRCLPPTYNYDFPNTGSGLPAATAVRTNTITVTASGTVTLRIANVGIPATTPPTVTSWQRAEVLWRMLQRAYSKPVLTRAW